MRASIPRESKCCNTNGRSVWTAGETIFGQIRPLHHSRPMNFSAHPCIFISRNDHVYLSRAFAFPLQSIQS